MDPKAPRNSAMNMVWLFLLLSSVLVGAATGRLEQVGKSSFQAAKQSVELAIGLVGAMTLWLGLVKVVQEAGLMASISKALRPLLVRLFPDVPADHPAMGAMVMNMAANMMGLGNAATPLGIKAMQELEQLNPQKGEATDAMCLFLAINTSSVTLLPLGVMAVRASAGARDPAGILIPTLLATTCSTIVAVFSAKLLARLYKTSSREKGREEGMKSTAPDSSSQEPPPVHTPQAQGWRRWILPMYTAAFVAGVGMQILGSPQPEKGIEGLSHALIPFLMGLMALYGVSRSIPVYERLCDGGKEGFQVALRIIPFLVAVLVGVGMFRASGALEIFTGIISPLTGFIGMPPETLPMALVRPLSGSGAFGMMSELVARDPDSLEAFIASVMQGSTDTTLYILAVYFGAVQVKRIRYALWAGLLGDAAGILAAVVLGRLFYS
jgi:spore maturation protein SpmA